jgi:hypothetical protein
MTIHNIVLSETQHEFLESDSYFRCIFGPIASGKSVLSVLALFKWACEQAPNTHGIRKTRFLVVRNTADQLKQTTIRTVLDWIPPEIGEYKVSEKTLYVNLPLPDGTRVESQWLFLPLDTPDDIRKCLSLEATGCWINEAREINGDIVETLLTRTDRYPSKKDGGATRAGGIADTNGPDQDSWWFNKFEHLPKNWSLHKQPPAMIAYDDYLLEYKEEPDERDVAEDSTERRFVTNPKADNIANLSRGYYPNATSGKSADHVDVYIRVMYGRSLSGLPVYDRTFRLDFHVATEALRPIYSDSYPILIGIDQGRTPAAVFGQIDPRGRLLTLSELTSENMGMETFIAQKVRPHINQRYPGFTFVMAPDPASWQKSQTNEQSPADVLKRAGFKLVRPATNKPELRIQSVERFLTQQIDGKAALLIDPGCVELIKGFRYGYRYKLRKDNTMDHSPDKNNSSHPHDALQYLCLIAEGGHTGWGTRHFNGEIELASAAGWT